MEIHQLRYFVEVINCGNFTRASERCHVSQPSLSQQLRKLEEELGQPLIKRTRRGALPTEFGQLMLAKAQKILAGIDDIALTAKVSGSDFHGTISIAAIPTIAPYCISALINACARTYPDIALIVSEDTTDELVDKLRLGQIDFGLLSPPYPFAQATECIGLGQDELLLALPQRHPLVKRRRVTLADLSPYSIILMKETHCLRRQSISLCETSGLKPSVSIESSQIETVISMVESGLGFSFIPAMASPSFRQRKVTFRSLQPEPIHREICLIQSRQPASPHLHRAFAKMAQNVLSKQLMPLVK